MGVDKVVQSKPEPSDKEQAMLAAANSGIDFSLPPEERPNKRGIIAILDDEDNEILDKKRMKRSLTTPWTKRWIARRKHPMLSTAVIHQAYWQE
jgi:hypothetical protein